MTPPVIESLRTLAGIANGERISQDTKRTAEEAILLLIRVVYNEAAKMAESNSPIMPPPPGFSV